jgi:hypothetical protein
VRIEEWTFCESGLSAIIFPSSVEVLEMGCFSECKFLESVTFESTSRLVEIAGAAFYHCGLSSLVIPSSVEVLGEEGFFSCVRLQSVTFTPGPHLRQIDLNVFTGAGDPPAQL